jgi:hypothetical protein
MIMKKLYPFLFLLLYGCTTDAPQQDLCKWTLPQGYGFMYNAHNGQYLIRTPERPDTLEDGFDVRTLLLMGVVVKKHPNAYRYGYFGSEPGRSRWMYLLEADAFDSILYAPLTSAFRFSDTCTAKKAFYSVYQRWHSLHVQIWITDSVGKVERHRVDSLKHIKDSLNPFYKLYK